MNTVDFKQAGGFPLTQDTLNFMQEANVGSLGALAAALNTLCGSRYVILSGCKDGTFNEVDSGVVAIDGEIMLFQGGQKTVNVMVVEEKTAVVYKDGSSKDAYINKYAKFSSGAGQIPWSAFKRVPSSMPASDVYAWAKAAKKPSYTASEITDFPKSMPASDVSAWAKATTKPAYTAAEVGAVPNARKINNKQLSADITLTAADVGAVAQLSGTWELIPDEAFGVQNVYWQKIGNRVFIQGRMQFDEAGVGYKFSGFPIAPKYDTSFVAEVMEHANNDRFSTCTCYISTDGTLTLRSMAVNWVNYLYLNISYETI